MMGSERTKGCGGGESGRTTQSDFENPESAQIRNDAQPCPRTGSVLVDHLPGHSRPVNRLPNLYLTGSRRRYVLGQRFPFRPEIPEYISTARTGTNAPQSESGRSGSDQKCSYNLRSTRQLEKERLSTLTTSYPARQVRSCPSEQRGRMRQDVSLSA